MPDTPPLTWLEPDRPGYPLGMSRGGKAPILSALGNLALLDTPGIGFSGSRKAGKKRIAVAVDCAEQAVQPGFTVISGDAVNVA